MSENTINNSRSSILIKRIIKDYITSHKTTLFYALFMMIIASAATGFHAWLVQPALDDILINSNGSMLIIIPLLIIFSTLIKGIATYIHTVKVGLIAHEIISKLQKQLFNKLMFIDLSYYGDASSGALISRLINDTNYVRMAIVKTTTGIIKDSLIIIFLITNMFYQNWQLALFSFFAFPLTIWPIVKIGRKIRKVSFDTQKEVGVFSNILAESIRGIRLIKAYCRQMFAIEKASDTINKTKSYYLKSTKITSRISPLMEFIGSLAIAVAILIGGILIINDNMSTGQFMSFLVSLLLAYKPVKSIGNLNANLQEGLSGAERIFNLLDLKKSKIETENNSKKLEIMNGEILIKNISFSYPGQNNLFENFSLNIPAGKKVAIVGPTGSGKSTIVNLILRFFDPDTGEILIDGQNIRNINIDSLRGSISLVSQDTNLFNDTIKNNIQFGKLNSDFEEIKIASGNAGANEFIEELPQGYNSLVGENGIKLSSGQKQRVAIARALIKNSKILLLDEATSSLDNLTEMEVQKAINLLMKNKTSLIVAHRLTTIENADLIYVLDKGKIIEQGNHKQLLNNNGLYKKLYTQVL
ncbi:MAG: Lipid A export ATP-binding/permease protein MsbA [Alphaproteobacteria bacterium MarineAlpha5_Bin12]|nr:MAG: Lipid A export ATP-binding/permease protein MsbA [Alphaproteobacteria bacterium MarineAlpha5_Bin12]|tara:strand:- start:15181 stop:16935 length:1755 start_codon:yes stop_codon:yes gene_type:complete